MGLLIKTDCLLAVMGAPEPQRFFLNKLAYLKKGPLFKESTAGQVIKLASPPIGAWAPLPQRPIK